MTDPTPEGIAAQLERDGIAELPMLLAPAQLAGLQRAFRGVLARPSFNTWLGYEQNEKWRILVENVMALHPAAFDLALHPLVTDALRRYLGPEFALTEARGWRTIRTRRNFHGWHADAWHDPSFQGEPREVKLAVYLSDVESGHFAYLAGTHRPRRAPRHWGPAEVAPLQHLERAMRGKAGSCFLFDTAGVHRQTTPCLTPRDVLFFNFHDPAVPIQAEDVANARYRPMQLNAGYLPVLDAEQARILGFGRARAAPEDGVIGRPDIRRFPVLHDMAAAALAARLEWQDEVGAGRCPCSCGPDAVERVQPDAGGAGLRRTDLRGAGVSGACGHARLAGCVGQSKAECTDLAAGIVQRDVGGEAPEVAGHRLERDGTGGRAQPAREVQRLVAEVAADIDDQRAGRQQAPQVPDIPAVLAAVPEDVLVHEIRRVELPAQATAHDPKLGVDVGTRGASQQADDVVAAAVRQVVAVPGEGAEDRRGVVHAEAPCREGRSRFGPRHLPAGRRSPSVRGPATGPCHAPAPPARSRAAAAADGWGPDRRRSPASSPAACVRGSGQPEECP